MIATFFWLFILAIVALFFVEGRDLFEQWRTFSGDLEPEEPEEPEEDTGQGEG